MFERYNEKARRVVFFARYEASQFGSRTIDTEHLLLGLFREEARMRVWVPRMDAGTARDRAEQWAERHSPTSTAVDLPLSKPAQHVLKQAAIEAERLATPHIGPEHLLLGLLAETGCVAERILREGGANAEAIRKLCAESYEPTEPRSFQRASYLDSGFRRLSGETIEIHGSRWNVDYIRDAIVLCRSYNWHWHKAKWKPRDIVIHRKNGTFSFDLGLVADPENFELVRLGWKKDHCFVCRWELFESENEHGSGYTNGHDWICMECCERFLQRPDFFSSTQDEMT